tara:strand:+ start:1359 stop:1766 length:408 start_codon:yes stop_codon:yes gene_type:complete
MRQFNKKIGESDLNINAPNEPYYKNGALLKQGIDLFIQEIVYLLDTDKGDIFASDFGSEAKEYIWKQSSSEQTLKQLLEKEINIFCDMSKLYKFEIDVKFLQGQSRDIAVIDFKVENKNVSSEVNSVRTFQYTFS